MATSAAPLSVSKRNLHNRLGRCIKKVRGSVKANPKSSKESAAIGICVTSVLHTRGKTIKRFSCGKNKKLTLQKLKTKKSLK